jgi:hypothetical protein
MGPEKMKSDSRLGLSLAVRTRPAQAALMRRHEFPVRVAETLVVELPVAGLPLVELMFAEAADV